MPPEPGQLIPQNNDALHQQVIQVEWGCFRGRSLHSLVILSDSQEERFKASGEGVIFDVTLPITSRLLSLHPKV